MNVKQAPRSVAKALLLPINPAAVIILGIYTTLWGLWVANPFWDVFTRAPLYTALDKVPPGTIPPELFWGFIAIACGLVIIYGAYKRQYYPLLVGAAVAGWHWLMIATLYFVGDWQNTGGITALALSIYGAFIYVNVRTNFSDKRNSHDVLS
jgi:hypothetical protein